MEVGFGWKCVRENFKAEVVNFGLVLGSWNRCIF